MIPGPGCSGGPGRRALTRSRIFTILKQQKSFLSAALSKVITYLNSLQKYKLRFTSSSLLKSALTLYIFFRLSHFFLACCGSTLPSRPRQTKDTVGTWSHQWGEAKTTISDIRTLANTGLLIIALPPSCTGRDSGTSEKVLIFCSCLDQIFKHNKTCFVLQQEKRG